MARYIGEYDCKIDLKGRVIIPVGLKKQIPDEEIGRLVINRGFEKCLTLFTRGDWEKETEKLNGLDSFNSLDRRFIRLFNSGATEVSLDSASRLNIPKKLLEYAEIESDVVLYAFDNKVEIWSEKNYNEHMAVDPDEYSGLAERVMARKNQGGSHE